MRKIIATTLAAAALAGCGTTEERVVYLPATTERPARTTIAELSDADIERMALDAINIEGMVRDEMCEPIRLLRQSGMSRAEIADFGLEQFEIGYGKPLTSTGRTRLRNAFNAC